MFYPVEVKKSSSPKRDWTSVFYMLDNLELKRGEGAVVCMCRESLPLQETAEAIPVGLI